MKAVALACLAVLGACDTAEAACRQALALGLDVSGSVDNREYRLQTDGLAAALTHPDVLNAFLDMPEAPVALSVFEWSGPGAQRLLVDWTFITDEAALAKVAARLRGAGRATMDLSTALGEAKAYGAGLLARGPSCWRSVLDLSGDGPSNGGPRPQDVRPAGILINGLVIEGTGAPASDGTGIGELSDYYRAYVIAGVDSFVETALGFEAFEKAMAAKLLRELQVVVIGSRQGPRQ
ncbi:DUF1194 domain-containing protein [Thetidibacter halocola]|uniref:DUF1194 domain-containing protein n=1 Tax=Thetidibacter halocola TaxID=2827239 RepID=A0A8J7WEC1_9RHOB|nr:DUF1194 domain-containing protein [Thetidibacter halocola]MBS0124814.1 DUF1194 domain-containing protein [Thetidibacter halocola]